MHPDLAAAAEAFDVAPVRLIRDRENAVWEVARRDGERAALRLHRPGYQSVDAIRSELWWMQAVAARGVAAPRPLPARDGELVAVLPTGRAASLVDWIDGAPLGEADVPLTGTATEQTARFHAIGRLVAQLHDAADRLELPGWFTRPSWDREAFLGTSPLWGRFWENPALADDERAALLKARETAAERLDQLPAELADFGLIHADVLRENVLFRGREPVLIDFDDSGFGYRLYDLATLASQDENEPGHAARMAAAFAGYREVRQLPAGAEAVLPLFVLLRRLASCGWIVPRARPGDPRLRHYAARAAAAARRFLQG